MYHRLPRKSLGALLIVVLSLTGCAELTYQRLNDPSRDLWQKPQGVVEKLSIARGARVADLGAGGGYFTWHLAKAVGARGTVYAVDIDEKAINMITKEWSHEGLRMSDRSEPNRTIQGFRSRSTWCSVVIPTITYTTASPISDLSLHRYDPAAASRSSIFILADSFPAYLVPESRKKMFDAKWKTPAIYW